MTESRPSGGAGPTFGGAGEVRGSSRPAAKVSEQPPSSRFDGEDFLFHLYRGSELLQDNCVEEAKEELERALRMQPLDVEGQGLLGAVYFRLGLYPRAIEIYREIVRLCPEEVTPKLNLSLCFLKTGQPGDARELLEDVLRRVPDHRRAWGYLGLSFERLGQYARAEAAFERAGQPHLARRMQQLLQDLTEVRSEREPPREELRRAAANLVEELDASADGAAFERAVQEPEASLRAGRWQAHEPGETAIPPLIRSRRASVPLRFTPSMPQVSEPPDTAHNAPTQQAPGQPAGALAPDALIAARRVALKDGRAGRTAEGLVCVPARQSFAVRSERVRAMTAEGPPFRLAPLRRRLRGSELDEPFGGVGAGWVSLEGNGWLVLEPSTERELTLLALGGEFVYLREARVVGFDGALRYENGRLPAAEPGPVPMVQLSGDGVVVFEARRSLAALTVTSERPLTVRAASVLGWTGRLLGQAVAAEQPSHFVAGFVAFSGDGAVLLDDP
jgi:hypothetical protein